MPPVNHQEIRLAEILKLNRLCLDLTLKALDEKNPASEDDLENLVKKRSKIIKRLIDIEADLEKKAVGGQETLSGISAENRARVQAMVEELKKVINDLVEADKKLKQKLEAGLHQVQGELDRLKKGQRVLKAYTPYGKTGAYYFSSRL